MSFGLSGSHSSSSSDLTSLISQIFSQATQNQQNTSGTTSGTSNQVSSGTSSGTESGSTARVLSPEQQNAQAQISKIISALSTNPSSFLAPAHNQAREQVNQNYGGLADSLRQQFLGGGGGGASGKFGTAALRSDLARRGELSGVDNSFASAGAMLPITAAGLAQNLLNTNLGQTSQGAQSGQTGGSVTGTSSGTSTGTSTGTSNTSGTSTQTGTQHGETSGTTIGANAGIKL